MENRKDSNPNMKHTFVFALLFQRETEFSYLCLSLTFHNETRVKNTCNVVCTAQIHEHECIKLTSIQW